VWICAADHPLDHATELRGSVRSWRLRIRGHPANPPPLEVGPERTPALVDSTAGEKQS